MQATIHSPSKSAAECSYLVKLVVGDNERLEQGTRLKIRAARWNFALRRSLALDAIFGSSLCAQRFEHALIACFQRRSTSARPLHMQSHAAAEV